MRHQKRIENPVYKANFWNNLRRERGTTFQYISNILGVSPTMVRYYFIGARMPKPEYIRLMCEGFNVDIDQGTEEFKKIHKAWKESQTKKAATAKTDNTSKPIAPEGTKTSTSCNFWQDVKNSAGVTYPQLAKVLGCSPATVGAFFSGFVLPKPDVIAKICDYFAVDTDVGADEFRKLFEDFGRKNQDKYKKSGNSYKRKSVRTASKRSRKSKKAAAKIAPNHTLIVEVNKPEDISKYMEAIYGVVSYELFTSISNTCDTLDKLLSFIYGEVDYDVFRAIERL